MTIAPLDRLITTGTAVDEARDALPLSSLLSEPFIVLLGAPGMGKSVALSQLAQLEGETCHPAFAVVEQQFTPGSTIYIDALDEIPVDEARSIARALQRTPDVRWRVSCRAESWNEGGRLSQAFGDKGASTGVAPAVAQLLPLTEQEAVRVLQAFGCADPAALLAKLEVIRSTAFAMTPLGLKFLTKANIESPSELTRFELYQSGVEHLAFEHNNTKQEDGLRATLSMEARLDIAGRVGLALLLSGKHRIKLSVFTDDTAVTCDDLRLDRTALTAVLDSALFIKTGDVFQPLHRSIQEFLAGRFLARLVTNGTGNSKLLAERALALIVSADGLPADGMRPLYAWYAGHLVSFGRPDEAMRLAQLDPDSLLLHGDTAKLPVEARLTVLRDVGSRDPFFRWAPNQWAPAEITTVGLITDDMLSQVIGMLAGETSGYRINMLLEALSVGKPHATAADACWSMVESQSGVEWCRRAAVKAWLHCAQPNIEAIWAKINYLCHMAEHAYGNLRSMAQLFCAIPSEHLDVTDVDRLLKMLMAVHSALYDTSKKVGGPTPTITYALRDAAWHVAPRSWRDLITEDPKKWRVARGKGSIQQAFASHLGIAAVMQFEPTAQEFTCLLIATGLIVGDDSSFSRAAREYIESRGVADDLVAEIAAVTDLEIADCGSIGMGLRILGISPSAASVSLLLNSSQLLAKTEGSYVGRQVVAWALRQGEATPDWLPALLTARLDREVVSTVGAAITAHEVELSILQARAVDSVEAQLQRRIKACQTAETITDEQLSELFYWGAEIYAGNTPLPLLACNGTEALNEAFGETLAGVLADGIVEDRCPPARVQLAAQASLRIDKGLDLIGLSTAEIIRVYLSAEYLRSSYLRDRLENQCISLLESAFRTEPEMLAQLSRANDGSWRTLLKRLGEKPRAGDLQAWAVKTLVLQPDMVDRGLLDAAQNLAWLNLDHGELVSVARTFIDRLVEQCKQEPEGRLYSTIISDRLQWAYFGVCIEPGLFSDDFTRALEVADDHTIHRLIVDDYPLKGFSTEPSTTISISTLLMQFFIARSPSMEGHYDRIRVDTAKVMKSIRLSGERLAESALKSLVAAAEGTAWELLLRHDLEVYRRDARALDYSLITPADLAKVIDSKGPISVRDLRALTLMELRKIAAEIQSSPLNIWSLYWNEGVPKPENDCRDILADKLRDRLRVYGDFEVSPEVASAGGTRADMVVTHGTLSLPFEAKRSGHSHLWYGHSGQLQTYTQAPSTEGQGIYIVFWFGKGLKIPAPPEGTTPDTPDALKVALEGQLPAELRAITSVVVLDLTDAGAAAKVRKESGYEQGKADKRESRASSRAKK
ncbi:NACHT domain-containing protein [Pseudomonas sp. NPDC089392]|uniref:NACHT domain-containing protein n=1 Tax=Pseudomonas sp. NPDC089392 TaxID=3364459 RepID=UPI0037F38F53